VAFSILDEQGGNHGRSLYRVGGHRCWCGLGLFHYLTNIGIQLIRKKSVSTFLNGVKARQSSAPQAPLHKIYYSLAEERAEQSQWLADANYVDVLRGTGCFNPRTAPQPEQFAELMASVEEKIQLQPSGEVK